MLTIRLSRTGKKHAPQYRIVLQEKGRDPWSPAIEILGHYNPRNNPSTIKLNAEKIKEWLSKGAQPSNTVHNILVKEGVIKADKVKAVSVTARRQKKLEEKKAEADEKKKEADAKKTEEKTSAPEATEESPAETTKEKTEEAKTE